MVRHRDESPRSKWLVFFKIHYNSMLCHHLRRPGHQSKPHDCVADVKLYPQFFFNSWISLLLLLVRRLYIRFLLLIKYILFNLYTRFFYKKRRFQRPAIISNEYNERQQTTLNWRINRLPGSICFTLLDDDWVLYYIIIILFTTEPLCGPAKNLDHWTGSQNVKLKII